MNRSSNPLWHKAQSEEAHTAHLGVSTFAAPKKRTTSQEAHVRTFVKTRQFVCVLPKKRTPRTSTRVRARGRKPKPESVESLSFVRTIDVNPVTLAGMLPPELLPGDPERYRWPKSEGLEHGRTFSPNPSVRELPGDERPSEGPKSERGNGLGEGGGDKKVLNRATGDQPHREQ